MLIYRDFYDFFAPFRLPSAFVRSSQTAAEGHLVSFGVTLP